MEIVVVIVVVVIVILPPPTVSISSVNNELMSILLGSLPHFPNHTTTTLPIHAAYPHSIPIPAGLFEANFRNIIVSKYFGMYF